MINKMKIIILMCSIIVGCRSSQSNTSINECTYERQVGNLVQKIIDTPELQQYFYDQNIKKDSLIVLMNDKFIKKPNIKKNGINVLFLSHSEISGKNIKGFLVMYQIRA